MMEFADGYEGVTHAGVLFVTRDTGEMLLAQRAFDDTDDPEVQETWEMPGGGLNPGEDPYAGALREFSEEVGGPVPDGEVVHGWRAGADGHYQGFVVAVDAKIIPDSEFFDPEEVIDAGWYTVEEARTLNLRPEFAENDLDALVAHAVSGNEDTMPEEITQPCKKCGETLTWEPEAEEWQAPDGSIGCDESGSHEVEDPAKGLTAAVEETPEIVDEEEPEFDPLEFAAGPLPVHGVIAPEEAESGDLRAFAAGAMTSRPLRIPFSWQKSAIGGHDGSVVVGSVDRVMRKDGLIHWEGLLMDTAEAGELVEIIEFFDNKFGVSVDGDKGNLDGGRSKETGVTWFDAVRAAGLTAVAIPAFVEAYVSLGPHPDMPAEMEDTEGVMTAGACSTGLLAFKRGKGWVTNPKETSRLHRYWTQKGQPGYAKIRWGTPGDWTRAKALIGEKIAKNSPDKMRFLNQIISQWHFDALGYWPGELGKPGNAPDTKENRRRAATHASADTSADTAVEASEIDNEGIEVTDEGWEAVLVSSVSGNRVKPPLEYFHRHESGEALVVEEPDENGIVRTYGYAAEWGVCHVGMAGRCVEPPVTGSDDYPEFHLGRTRTDQGYVNTGVLTYGVGHRDADTILSESPDQAYFDNVNNAWAAVRVGEDERGIWFSGVVLPGVPEDHLVKIEASGQVSGEWLYGAMRACLTVNVPGFPVQRASVEYDENGNVMALAASAFGNVDNGTQGSECDPAPTPMERMAALKQADAEARFENMKALFEKNKPERQDL